MLFESLSRLCCLKICQVSDGIDTCHVFKGEVLTIEYHPFVAALDGHLFDVWEQWYRHDDYAPIGQSCGEFSTHIKVHPLDFYVDVWNLAHNRCLTPLPHIRNLNSSAFVVRALWATARRQRRRLLKQELSCKRAQSQARLSYAECSRESQPMAAKVIIFWQTSCISAA